MRVFCSSMADIGETLPEPHPDHYKLNSERQRVFDLIEKTPFLDWQLLTKRPHLLAKLIPERWQERGCPDNVWVGVTVENQQQADIRIYHLVRIPARIHFLSMEPLFEFVNLDKWLQAPGEWRCTKCRYKLHKRLLRAFDGAVAIDDKQLREVCPNDGSDLVPASLIDWVITGGESGKKARPGHPDWYRSLRDQAEHAGVPFLFKQWGEWAPAGDAYDTSNLCHVILPSGKDRDIPWSGWIEDQPYAEVMRRFGKKLTGRILDGRTWDGFPKVEGVV